MIMFGPVSAGYPGKWTMYAFIVAVSAIYGTAIVHFYRQKRPFVGEASESISNKPSREVSRGQIVGFGIICLVLIGIALWTIHLHRPS
jgi:hypothetical protein